jgi:hypothetical protein
MEIAATYSAFLSIRRRFLPQVFFLDLTASYGTTTEMRANTILWVHTGMASRGLAMPLGFSAFSIVVPAHEKGRARIMSLKEGMDLTRLIEKRRGGRELMLHDGWAGY